MLIETNLPEQIHGFQYVKNSHYIRLTDDKKREIKLYAKKILRGECPQCKLALYSDGELAGMKCPRCQTPMRWVWGKEQLSFIPDEESEFMKD